VKLGVYDDLARKRGDAGFTIDVGLLLIVAAVDCATAVAERRGRLLTTRTTGTTAPINLIQHHITTQDRR